MRFSMALLIFGALSLSASPALAGPDAPVPAAVEVATGPEGLLQLEQQGKVTVRALRAWGRLPGKFVGLAQRMRQEAGLDLLGADVAQIRLWGASDDASMAPYRAELAELADLIGRGEHLDWTAPPKGASVPAGNLVRHGAMRWTQTADGPVSLPAGTAAVAQTATPAPMPQSDQPVPAPAPVTADVAWPEDGLVFPINDQIPGTFKVRLQVEGLQQAQPDDDPYFARVLPRMLPDDPAMRRREQAFFSHRADYAGDSVLTDAEEARYDLFLGFATMDTPVVVRVEAPDDPAIPLSEKEIQDRVSYRVAGKSLRFFLADEATGDADIGYTDDTKGEAHWTPRADPGTGRPVGPRALGVYIAYQVKKSVSDYELGILAYRYRRIGWVVVAMPGDLYEHGDAVYAIGQAAPQVASGSVAMAPAPAPDDFDFELPQYALDEGQIRLSEDLRHVAWIDGEEEGKKRVVLNGVPGKWYDDIRGYNMRFSAAGESFCFEATLGDKKIPVCNGVEGPLFDDIETLVMSDDGAQVLVAGKIGESYRVFLDGKQVRDTPLRVSKAVIAASGKAAWIERGREEQTGAEFAMVVSSDGSEGQKYSAIHGDLLFTRAPSTLYYIAESADGQRYLMRNGEQLEPTLGVGYEFSVTPDGKHYAFASPLATGEERMVIDGQVGPVFTAIWSPAVFNVDGSRHIYEGKRDEEPFLVVDGQVVNHDYGPLKSILGETFSPDGKRWAVGLQLNDKEYVILVDGKEIGRGQGSPRQIVFSPDGSRVAWLEKKQRSWRAYLDGEAGPEVREIHDDEPPQFSPDGRHLVYFYRDAEKKMHVAVFGGEDRVHDMIPPRIRFTVEGPTYLALEGKRLRRLSLPLQ